MHERLIPTVSPTNPLHQPTDFDWLSDLSPVLAARAVWQAGTYGEPAFCQVRYDVPGPFAVACGAGLLAEHVRHFRFSPAVIGRLFHVTDVAGRSEFDESFLNFLQRLRLRVEVQAPAEGTLLLPGEPLALVQGPLLQVHLLVSAFRLLLWESTHWATRAAMERWQTRDWVEEDSPTPLPCPANPAGWRARAAYIGGGSVSPEAIFSHHHTTTQRTEQGQTSIEISVKNQYDTEQPAQIRRLFQNNHPLGDMWLNAMQEAEASVSKSTTAFFDDASGRQQTVHFTRFQNLYQPVLVKGHPALAPPAPDYLRQRTLKQLEAFSSWDLAQYPHGFMKGN